MLSTIGGTVKYLIFPAFQSCNTIFAAVVKSGHPFVNFPLYKATLLKNSVVVEKSAILYWINNSFLFPINFIIYSIGVIGSSSYSILTIFLKIAVFFYLSSSKITPGQSIILTFLSIITSYKFLVWPA